MSNSNPQDVRFIANQEKKGYADRKALIADTEAKIASATESGDINEIARLKNKLQELQK